MTSKSYGITPDDLEPDQVETQTSAVPARLQTGKIGNYELIRMVGRGGMGEVWLAHDEVTRRKTAIKVMRRELLDNEEAVARFYREAQMLTHLTHANIIRVYEVGEDAGQLFLAMEWADMGTLSDMLDRDGALPFQDARMLLAQVLEGLAAACDKGMIHRDIKPGNILLKEGPTAKLGDFGLAKLIGSDTRVTMSGVVLGSPMYMSPEQIKGQDVDHRSDMYSLGMTFFHMLTGAAPFTGTDALAILYKHVNEPLPEPPALVGLGKGQVYPVIRKMTEKQPDRRYQDYDELRFEVTRLSELGDLPALDSQAIPIDSMPTVRTEREESIQGQATPFGGDIDESIPTVGRDVEPAFTGFGLDDFEREAAAAAMRQASQRRSYAGLIVTGALVGVLAIAGTFVFLLRKDIANVFRSDGKSAPVAAAITPTATPAPIPVPRGALTIRELTEQYRGKSPEQISAELGTPDFISDQKETLGALCYRSTRWDKPIYDELTGKRVFNVMVTFRGDECNMVQNADKPRP